MRELKNLFTGVIAHIILVMIILLVLRFLAGDMGAGSAGYNLSFPFLTAQGLTSLVCYVSWYRKINREAADLLDLSDMQKKADYYAIRTLLTSVAITFVITLVALAVMLLDLFRLGIPAIYTYTSASIMLIICNFALALLLRFVRPGRVIGLH